MSWLSKSGLGLKVSVPSKTELVILFVLVALLLTLLLCSFVYLSRKQRPLNPQEVLQSMGFSEPNLYLPTYQTHPVYQAVDYSYLPPQRFTQPLAFGNQFPFVQQGGPPLWFV